MARRQTFVVVAFCFSLSVAQVSNKCSDGKSAPLLEGEDNNVFPCISDCPTGFFCEIDHGEQVGMCCPSTELLNELYGDNPNEITPTVATSTLPSTTVEPREIRHAPTRAARVPLQTIAEHEFDQQQIVQQVDPFVPKTHVCERLPLETHCEADNNIRATQLVIRWHVQNGKCHSYPFGFCPGTRVENDPTLRTKDECELLCLSAEEFRHSDLFEFLSNSEASLSHQAEFDSLDEIQETTTLPAPDKKLTETPRACSEVLPFTSICRSSGRASHFTERWTLLDGACVSYPYGYCSEDFDPNELVLNTEQLCRQHCQPKQPVRT